MDLNAIINRTDTLAGRVFDLIVQAMIVFSMVTFAIETLPDIKASTKDWLEFTEALIIIFFTLEYLLRIYVAEKKMSYMLSFYGIIDLLAIVPFYISSGVDVRSLRMFRILRLFQIMKLFRYNKAVRRFSKVLALVKEEIILYSVVTAMLLYLSATGIYYFENKAQPEAFKSIFHSLWWAIITLTTVGYGDVYPITVGGRIFTFVILMIGLSVIAIPAGVLASALSKVRMEDQEEK